MGPKTVRIGLIQGGGCINTHTQKIVGLKLCWVVVSIATRWSITFRPLGPFFLVELEFLGGGWGGGWWVV